MQANSCEFARGRRKRDEERRRGSLSRKTTRHGRKFARKDGKSFASLLPERNVE
jgi:hypothetical protein